MVIFIILINFLIFFYVIVFISLIVLIFLTIILLNLIKTKQTYHHQVQILTYYFSSFVFMIYFYLIT